MNEDFYIQLKNDYRKMQLSTNEVAVLEEYMTFIEANKVKIRTAKDVDADGNIFGSPSPGKNSGPNTSADKTFNLQPMRTDVATVNEDEGE